MRADTIPIEAAGRLFRQAEYRQLTQNARRYYNLSRTHINGPEIAEAALEYSLEALRVGQAYLGYEPATISKHIRHGCDWS